MFSEHYFSNRSRWCRPNASASVLSHPLDRGRSVGDIGNGASRLTPYIAGGNYPLARFLYRPTAWLIVEFGNRHPDKLLFLRELTHPRQSPGRRAWHIEQILQLIGASHDNAGVRPHVELRLGMNFRLEEHRPIREGHLNAVTEIPRHFVAKLLVILQRLEVRVIPAGNRSILVGHQPVTILLRANRPTPTFDL
jgi:hypothetical protein